MKFFGSLVEGTGWVGKYYKLDKQIFEIEEDIRALNDIYELVLFDYNYLTSPNKLMEYSKIYFDKELKKKKITDLKIFKFNNE